MKINDWCFASGTTQDVKPATQNTVYGDWVYIGRKTYTGSKVTTDTEKYVYVSSKDDFAEKLEKLIIDTELRKNFGLSAKNIIKNYSEEKVINMWKNTINDI